MSSSQDESTLSMFTSIVDSAVSARLSFTRGSVPESIRFLQDVEQMARHLEKWLADHHHVQASAKNKPPCVIATVSALAKHNCSFFFSVFFISLGVDCCTREIISTDVFFAWAVFIFLTITFGCFSHASNHTHTQVTQISFLQLHSDDHGFMRDGSILCVFNNQLAPHKHNL
ncbi:hypothetical protein K457DRAFT_410157 [Linnemannia elongata AG-77]|uniref:Uncharacterized protein n=1 Tax=Linnemannia elongata AG-77 TaxID=1314771 RepID=A0A197K0X2_9FUNG|nr:hypothetical protein K457DRAFT_410157 [Linnemannia elongata AG-77]